MKYFILGFFFFTQAFSFAQSECSKFKIAGIYDFPPSPSHSGGNYFLMLLTVHEDLNVSFDPFYTTLYFLDEDDNIITDILGGGYTLPNLTSDTIPYVMKLSSEMSNLDFPKESNSRLYFQTVNTPTNPTECWLDYKDGLTSTTESEMNKNINVYPNPVDDILHIEGVKISVLSIWNERGDLVLKDKSLEQNSYFLKHLVKGIYFAEIITDQATPYSFSFIKI